MKTEYMFLGCLILAVLAVFLIVCIRVHRHKKAKYRVKQRSDKEKLNDINGVLQPFGFAYDLSKDIFYSLEHAWQRNMGYGKIYDIMAPSMNMVIDCEPIYFEYDNRLFMIELWKGQYGVTTGAEVGIYTAEKQQKEPEEVFYQTASEKDLLFMDITLWKNGRKLFQREKLHWWLTGFVLGEFSYPGELMLEVSISFTEYEMMEEFIRGCYRAGYLPEDLNIHCNQVGIWLTAPKTKQPAGRKWRRKFAQWQNRHNCRIYARVTKPVERTLDKIDYLMQAYPGIFHIILKMGRIGFSRK